MEVEERLEKFEATIENTNTKVGMLHPYFLNSHKTLILLTLLVRRMYFDDVNDVKITLVTLALIMNFGLSREIWFCSLKTSVCLHGFYLWIHHSLSDSAKDELLIFLMLKIVLVFYQQVNLETRLVNIMMTKQKCLVMERLEKWKWITEPENERFVRT